MNKKQRRQVADVEFIFGEAARFAAMPWSEVAREDKFLCWLPHPSGGGSILCGRAAIERLENLAREAGDQAKLTHRLQEKVLKDALAEELVRRFVRDAKPIDGKAVDQALGSAGRVARRRLGDRVHLLPCHLMHAKDPNEICIGPVRFLNRRAARRRWLELLRARRAARTEPIDPEQDDAQFLAQAIGYCRNFGWLAEVEIKACDQETSDQLATAAVTSALDCLHLILGARWSDRMQVGGPALRFDRRASLCVREGALEYSISTFGFGQVNFEDGWSEMLALPDRRRLLLLCGVALEAAVDPDLDRPISRRLLDAAQWFGEATRDRSPATRVVKYVTTLERMLMTEERDDIANTIANRLAAMCYAASSAENHARWRDRALRIYDLRSRLVHGSLSPNAPDVLSGVGEAARLAEAGVLHALNLFGVAGLREGKVSARRMGRWFNDNVALAERLISAPSAQEGPEDPIEPASQI